MRKIYFFLKLKRISIYKFVPKKKYLKLLTNIKILKIIAYKS
jgi:hypothetical protein